MNYFYSLTKIHRTFSELMKKANEQQKEKYKWMYEKEDQLMLEDNNEKTKMIEGPDQSRNAEIGTWKYEVIFLYFNFAI